jgi:hypothetical protein
LVPIRKITLNLNLYSDIKVLIASSLSSYEAEFSSLPVDQTDKQGYKAGVIGTLETLPS